MGSIAEFLLARITEDEEVARAALAPEEMHPWGDLALPQTRPRQAPDEMRGYLGGPWGEHAARWDMTRVLAECEAKRRIVEMHRPKYLAVYRESERLLAEAFNQETMKVAASSGPIWTTSASERTLKTLALPYANHPDYDEEWRP